MNNEIDKNENFDFENEPNDVEEDIRSKAIFDAEEILSELFSTDDIHGLLKAYVKYHNAKVDMDDRNETDSYDYYFADSIDAELRYELVTRLLKSAGYCFDTDTGHWFTNDN